MSLSHTVAEAQTALKSLGFDPKAIDGAAGPATAAAVAAFQAARNLTVNGNLDDATLAQLFPTSSAPESGPRTLQATMTDWILNYAQSKIVYVAGLMVIAVVSWVNTKFGFQVPKETTDWVTSGLVMLGGAVIIVLRGWAKDSPKIVSAIPGVIQDQTRFK